MKGAATIKLATDFTQEAKHISQRMSRGDFWLFGEVPGYALWAEVRAEVAGVGVGMAQGTAGFDEGGGFGVEPDFSAAIIHGRQRTVLQSWGLSVKDKGMDRLTFHQRQMIALAMEFGAVSYQELGKWARIHPRSIYRIVKRWRSQHLSGAPSKGALTSRQVNRMLG